MHLEGFGVIGGLAIGLSGERSLGPRGELGLRFGLVPPFHERVDLDLRVSTGASYLITGVDLPTGDRFESNSLLVDLMVGAEGTFGLTGGLHVLVGAELGGVFSRSRVDQAFIGPQYDNGGAFAFRFRLGARLHLSDVVWLDVRPVSVTTYVRSGVSAVYELVLGLSLEVG